MSNLFKVKHHVVEFLVLAFYVIEFFIGISQFFYNYSEPESWLFYRGSFTSSSFFASFSVIQLPLSLNFLKKNEKKDSAFSLTYFFLILSVTIVVLMTHSRNSFFLLSFYILFMSNANCQLYKFRTELLYNKFRVLFLLIIIVLCILIYLNFYNKSGSIYGRLLIWEIVFKNCKNFFWFGVGYGKFPQNYPLWQSSYFENNSSFLLNKTMFSGETYLCFNEFLQLFSEIGFCGFILFFYLLYKFFVKTNKENNIQSFTFKQVLLLILISGITSFTWHVSIFLLIGFYCIASVLRNEFNCKIENKKYVFKNELKNILVLIALIVVSYTIAQSVSSLKYSYEWHEAKKISKFDKEKLHQYKYLNKYLSMNSNFLQDYGNLLYQFTDSIGLATKLLQKAKLYEITYNISDNLANCYILNGDYDDAIKEVKFLKNFVPHYFTPRYTLMKLYLVQKDTTEAIKIGKEIIDLPIKVKSDQVDYIKRNTAFFILHKKMLNDTILP